MRFLLDVNILLALALVEHSSHQRVVDWLKRTARQSVFSAATCAITELGFIRILSQPAYGYSIGEARLLLEKLKEIEELRFIFLADDQPASNLPPWVVRPAQITDGHLLTLAERCDAKLATLDEKIPGAFLIPA